MLALLLMLPLASPASPASPASSAAITAPAAGTDDGVVRHKSAAFGTVVEIMAIAPSGTAGASAPFEAAFDEVRRIEALIDEDAPKSVVARINEGAGGEAIVVDPDVFAVLSELQRLAKLTKGAFDVTGAAYASAWQFDAGASGTDKERGVPQKKDIDKVRALVGFDDLVLDAAARTARLKTKGARIGVRSVARGHALERAAAVLEQKGVTDFVIAASGDLIVRGTRGARPWMVGVQDPRAAGHFAALGAPSSAAVMTTGDYEEFFFDGGVRYHNVIDPRTGQPATKCRSVTVVAKDALTAEGLSRAVFVLGAKDGMALVERLKGVDAVVVTSDNKVVLSKGLRNSLQHRPPTDGP
jgi:thiamine biosynthesis lipoprotein